MAWILFGLAAICGLAATFVWTRFLLLLTVQLTAAAFLTFLLFVEEGSWGLRLTGMVLCALGFLGTLTTLLRVLGLRRPLTRPVSQSTLPQRPSDGAVRA